MKGSYLIGGAYALLIAILADYFGAPKWVSFVVLPTALGALMGVLGGRR